MFLNYLKLAFRLMTRNPFFTFINILGLAIGFASFFALWDFSSSELQSDQYYQDSDRIVRINYDWRWTDDGQKWDNVKGGMSKSDIPLRAKEDFAEVEDFTRIHKQFFFDNGPGGLVPHGRKIMMAAVGDKPERVFKEERIVYADANLFTFFSIPLVYGEATKVLTEPGSIVLSESQAIKYFGQRNPIGELLTLNDSHTLNVTGVFKNLPHNTHFTFNMVISNAAYLNTWATAFNAPTVNYVRLTKGTSFQAFEDKLNEKKDDYFAALHQRIANTDVNLFVQPLPDIVFSDNFVFDEFTLRSKSLLITFAIISIVLLAMAWINYINLWIARNRKREKELATRKINGARGKDFVFQFFVESFVVNTIAFLLAFTLLQMVRNPFKQLLNIEINPFWQLSAQSSLIFVLAFFFSIALTGLYPAWIVRNNHPLSLVRKSGSNNNGGLLSSSLVIVQYASAVALMLWSSIVYFELNHILQQEVGLDRENVLLVEVPTVTNTEDKLDDMMNRLDSDPFIANAAYGLFSPGESALHMNTRKLGSSVQVGFEGNGVSEHYLPLFGLKLVAGRNFKPDDHDDVAILSEIALTRLGFANPADAVGTRLEFLKVEAIEQWPVVEIIGVVKDYRSAPLFQTASASSEYVNEYQSQGNIYFYKNRGFEPVPYDRLMIKIRDGQLDKVIASIEGHYMETFAGTPFTWFFLEDRMNKVYSNEKITRNQIVLFVMLAIIIACLGFLGMITHKVTSRTKEIGIRKVLGASLSHIGQIILRPSSVQFAIAVAIGMPVAWYLGQQYLQKFTVRIELQWWRYLLPIVILVLIMLSTIATVVWKAARNNPVDSLKHE
jgi:putative ABC transport system permease protein